MARFSGLTSSTPKNMLLDAGMFFKNYDTSATYSTQMANCLGATEGGGSFSAVPTVRHIAVDGAVGNVKELEVIDEWVVTMTINLKEITAANLKLALGAAEDGSTLTGYGSVIGKTEFAAADYLTNLTWVGRLAGEGTKPAIIMVKNALSMNGLSMTFADKDEATVAVTVTGHYSLSDLDTPPFEIFLPTIT